MKAIESRPVTKHVKLAPNLPQDLGSRDPNVLWTLVCFGRFLRGNVKNSIFKDIAHIGGREVNPISKKMKRNDFLTKVGEGGDDKTYCQK